MTNNNIMLDGNIVSPLPRQAAGSGRSEAPGDLLTLVCGVAQRHLLGLMNILFENVDDALFDLAEKAENNAAQTRYFYGMREVRKKRQVVGSAFQQHLGKTFGDFVSGRLPPKGEGNGHGHGSGDLSLVEDAELDESLAIASIVAKAKNRFAAQLLAVNQRLYVICGGASVEDANNPFAPELLCKVFRIAMRQFDLDDQTRLIIYKLFDRYVMSGLDTLYDEVNGRLIEAGVLPTIRHSLPRSGGTEPRPSGAPFSPAAVAGPVAGVALNKSGSLHDNPAAALLEAEIHNTIRSLLARRRIAPAGQQFVADYPADAPRIAPIDLLSALRMLQNQAMMARGPVSLQSDAALIVAHIKQDLLVQARCSQGLRNGRVAGVDEDTIDLVGMLFEFILQDRNLQPQMQALFGRLQIPFLKVALVDRHLFAQKNHPARQLLDSMAQACMGWTVESDRDLRLHGKVKATIETLLKDFDDDVGLFDRLRADFEAFLQSNKKRTDLAELRTVEATRGREKLDAARRISAREILKRVEGKQLPDIVHNVLTRPWANYLVLMLLRHGENSNECHLALHFADQFAWSGQAKTSAAERARLKGLLPALEKSLRHSLAAVAYHDSDVKQLMQELHEFYAGILNGEPAQSEQPAAACAGVDEQSAPRVEQVSKAAATAAAVESPVEEIVMRGEAAGPAPDTDHVEDDECLRLAREMKIGAWVEFSSADTGRKERAKLSWISPISSNYLFVNRSGLQVSDKTVFALAAEIRRGAALLLEAVPLTDRALRAIVAGLKASLDAAPSEPLAKPA